MAGYSGTPLAKKLGLKPDMIIQVLGYEGHYAELFQDLPDQLHYIDDQLVEKDFIHFFVKNLLY